jgi:hypothetical protein
VKFGMDDKRIQLIRRTEQQVKAYVLGDAPFNYHPSALRRVNPSTKEKYARNDLPASMATAEDYEKRITLVASNREQQEIIDCLRSAPPFDDYNYDHPWWDLFSSSHNAATTVVPPVKVGRTRLL